MLEALVTIGLFYVVLGTGLVVLVRLEPPHARQVARPASRDELAARRRRPDATDEQLPLSA